MFFSLEFSKQIEKHYSDGTKEITFPIRPSSICTPMALRNACSATEQYRKSTKLEREPLSFQMDSEKCTPNIIK